MESNQGDPPHLLSPDHGNNDVPSDFQENSPIASESEQQSDDDGSEVLAINSLHAALDYPPLPGWLVSGGDQCAEGWQGVQCVNSNTTGIILNGANLEGEFRENLGSFVSIIQIDFSNNHIGGRPRCMTWNWQ
ncbi:hypothetical protein M8C21_029696 [Ambrosia artemisiifolia]|uniref:Leucine-rich repeat-containing N-terminal plant-type domain-containing protein n=1 Tax=Ambrosia artemisiifolia TaxID=4212 RepID=A0AAD5BN51_AMBAR|nr:hypothetical protein M8C21_029696 [Ambrosia artemisiifolia]